MSYGNVPWTWGEGPEECEECRTAPCALTEKPCGECGSTPCSDPDRCRFMARADRDYERKGDR